MSMLVVVTRNVKERIRGFLSSAMLEVAPAVYTAPRISPAVRDRIWEVMQDWFFDEKKASIVMLWSDSSMPGGQDVRVLGLPPVDLEEIDGMIVSRRDCTK